MEMCDDAQEMSCLASRHEDKGCDVKLASKAGQRINRSFEFQVQAISADKLPFILHAVVVFTAIAPIADGTPRYDDNLSRKSADDDVVRGVIERDTLALAASMAMEEIVRATTSSSINHHAVFEFENVQLELKQFGRLIVYDACIYVKPQSVDFSYGAGQAGKAQDNQEEVQSSTQPIEMGEIMESCRRAPRAQDNQEEVQSSRQPIKMGEIMESCRKAYESLKHQILQVARGNNDTTAGQLKEQKKSWSNYGLKALFFAITMFSASMYQNQSTPAVFTLGYRLFLIAIFVSVVMDAVLIILLPIWSNALVFISWILLEAASSLIVLSLNAHYALAILTVVFVILVVALLQPKHAVKRHELPSINGDTKEDIDDEENQYLGHLFDLAQDIANCGGIITAIFGHYMVGPVTAVGFFFLCSITLGLYIMMVITVRAVARPHVTCLAIVLMVLLVITLITVSIPFARHSGRNQQVVKYSNHRKTLNML